MLLLQNGSWVNPSNATVHRNTVTLLSLVPISGVRHGWGGMPDCMLYNGEGGAMNHTGLVAAPFSRCLYGTVADLPAWSWLSDCNPAPPRTAELSPLLLSDVAGGAVANKTLPVPSAETEDYILGATAVVEGIRDASTSGAAVLSTGVPKGSAVFVNRHALACGAAADGSGAQLLDSVEMTLRYRAAPLNASTNNTAAVLKVSLINADNRPVAVVAAALTLGNYSEATGWSAPVQVKASGLKESCSAGLRAKLRARLFL